MRPPDAATLHSLATTLTLVAFALPVRAQTVWRQPFNGAGRANHAMSYDPLRDRVFMFGSMRAALSEQMLLAAPGKPVVPPASVAQESRFAQSRRGRRESRPDGAILFRAAEGGGRSASRQAL